MKIVAYNMRAGSEPHWSAVRAAFNPDVVLAQESLAPTRGAHALGTSFWSAVPRTRTGWGSAIAITSGRATRVDVPEFEGWVVAADVTTPGDGVLRIVSVHVPSGRGPYVSVAGRILDRLAELPRPTEFLIGGDFNLTVARRQPNEGRKNSRSELALLERLEHEFDVLPAWEIAHPGRPLPQTLRWTGNASEPYHCDGVFVPANWSRSVINVEVVSGGEWDRLSDHNPVVVRLDGSQGLELATPRNEPESGRGCMTPCAARVEKPRTLS